MAICSMNVTSQILQLLLLSENMLIFQKFYIGLYPKIKHTNFFFKFANIYCAPNLKYLAILSSRLCVLKKFLDNGTRFS